MQVYTDGMHTPRITAEADIGERDASVVLDNFQLIAHSVFPGSIEGTRIENKRLMLDMTRPTTMPGDENRERCHAQIRIMFERIGLHDVVIEEISETKASPAQTPPALTLSESPGSIATQTMA